MFMTTNVLCLLSGTNWVFKCAWG